MSTTLGQSVKQAVLFLEQIFSDVYSLVRSLDGTMVERGWQSLEPNRITRDLGNGLNAQHWVLNTLYRLYAPAKGEYPDRALAVEIQFTPEDHDEAMILVAAVRLPKDARQSRAGVMSVWADSRHVFRFLAGTQGPREINEELRKEGFFDGAEEVKAFLVPLCELSDAETVRRRLVEPALALLGA